MFQQGHDIYVRSHLIIPLNYAYSPDITLHYPSTKGWHRYLICTLTGNSSRISVSNLKIISLASSPGTKLPLLEIQVPERLTSTTNQSNSVKNWLQCASNRGT